MAASSVLQKLSGTDPRALLGRSPQGDRALSSLHRECKVAGLLDQGPVPDYEMDDIRKLQGLFDVALGNGLCSLVMDYVFEVCHDKYAVSSDAFEARLMEPGMVRDWCKSALEGIQANVCPQGRSLSSISNLAASGVLRSASAQTHGLVSVLEVLASHRAGLGATPSQLDTIRIADRELQDALRLHHCLTVVKWCAEQSLERLPPAGRHSSRPAWALRCEERATAMQSRSGPQARLFLADFIAAAAPQGAEQLLSKYPPSSLEEAISGLFLQGGTSELDRARKLGVMLYYLEDAGHVPQTGGELHTAFRQSFRLSFADIYQYQAGLLLDCALAGEAGKLDEACRLLSAAGSPETPFKFAEVLSTAFGRHSMAHTLLQAGVGTSTEGSLHQAVSSMGIRLSCNMLAEAYLAARQHCAKLPASSVSSHQAALMKCLLVWAIDHKALNETLKLPFSTEEEAILHKLMQAEAKKGAIATQLLPLYYLQRGRVPEALLSADGTSKGHDGDASARACALLLSSANRLLPLAQRQLCNVPADLVTPAARAAPVLTCSKPPAGADASELDHVALLRCSSRGLLQTSLFRSAVPVPQPSSAGTATAMQTDSVKAGSFALTGSQTTGGRPGTKPTPSTYRRPQDAPRGVLFSGTQVHGQATSGAAATDPAGQMSQQEFTEMIGLPSKPVGKQKGPSNVKRARTTRK